MTPRIVVLGESGGGLLERLAAVRADGNVPLVGNDRWPAAQWDAVRALAAAGPVPENAAWATLTSGTSGAPRIVLRSAASWERSFAAVSALYAGSDGAGADGPGAGGPESSGPRTGGSAADERILLPSPPASSMTLFSLAHALAGGPQPVRPGRAGQQAAGPGTAAPCAAGASAADLAEVTIVHGTPEALRAVLTRDDLPCLRMALVGGSHLAPSVRTAAEARGIRLISYYGAAELSFVAIDAGEGLRAFPGAELEVRGGELWVCSPYTALGSRGGSGPLRTDGDWATVGDLATLEHGVLTVHGRGDGAILTASATVIPEEVEAGLRELPGVADALVLALPTNGIGALVAAMIEPEPGRSAPSACELRALAGELFTSSHRPRIWFQGPLPRTASGKPSRAEALRRVQAGEVARCA